MILALRRYLNRNRPRVLTLLSVRGTTLEMKP